MKKILIALSLCGVLVSCNKFLDMTPRDSISDKVMWSNVESAEYAVNDIYSYTYEIVAEWPSAVGMTEAFTDAFKYGSYVNFAFCLIPSQVAYGGTNLTNSFVDVYLGRWGDLYDAVRRTNEAIQQYERELQYLMDNCDMRFFRASRANCTVTFYKSMNAPERVLSIDKLITYFVDSPFKNGLMDYENYFNVQRTDLVQTRPIFHQSEELQWNFIDSVPSFDENGVMTGTYGIIRNVNALINKQEQLKRETERANQSGMLKSTFMANMTHEIRTPLNAIVGFSDVLPMLQTPEEKQEIIRVIMNNCDMLLRLINDILAVSDLEGGHIHIMPVKTDFAHDFDDICKSLAQRVQMPGVEFLTENPYQSLVTTIDKERIMQVFTNFVTNAVKYTKQGHIKIGYDYREQEGIGGLYFYCEDTGAGIKKEDQGKVFERFVKLNDYVQGTGLGLNISKAIIENCKGKIGLTSEGEGKGSTFWAWIPCEAVINNE